jgi:hypothetical protein
MVALAANFPTIYDTEGDKIPWVPRIGGYVAHNRTPVEMDELLRAKHALEFSGIPVYARMWNKGYPKLPAFVMAITGPDGDPESLCREVVAELGLKW